MTGKSLWFKRIEGGGGKEEAKIKRMRNRRTIEGRGRGGQIEGVGGRGGERERG